MSNSLEREIAEQQQIEAEQRHFSRRMAEIERQEQLQQAQHERTMREIAARREADQRAQTERERLQTENERLSKELAKAKVTSAHPDWRQVIRTDAFQSWFKNQPKHITDRANSWDPEDTIFLLTAFKKAHKGKY